MPKITESSEWQSERNRDVDVEECPSASENSDTCGETAEFVKVVF